MFQRLDFPIWISSRELKSKMRVMWFRDMNWVFDSVPKEPELNAVMAKLCEKLQPRVFWDVGANLGWFSWFVNARTTLSRACLFEPLPLNARLLEATIRRGGFSHMKLVQAAVSDRCGRVSFKVDEKSGAASQIKQIYDESGESTISRAYGLDKEITVECTTLDALLEAGEPVPDLLKMDIESAEYLALKGAARLLAQKKTIIAFECCKTEALDRLGEEGWTIFGVDRLENYLAVPPPLLDVTRGITDGMTVVNCHS